MHLAGIHYPWLTRDVMVVTMRFFIWNWSGGKKKCWACFPQCTWNWKLIYKVTCQGVGCITTLQIRQYQEKIYTKLRCFFNTGFIFSAKQSSFSLYCSTVTYNQYSLLSACGSDFTEVQYEDRGNTCTMSLLTTHTDVICGNEKAYYSPLALPDL